MIINFRQGVVDYDLNTFPFIASVFNISLIVGTRPITVTVAQATNNYTFQENTTVNNAWTVPSSTGTYWLYWDFNTQTLTRTFGYTSLQPYAQITAPSNPQNGQMWYNTATFRNYVYQFGGWTEVLRVFACKFVGSVLPQFQFISMGDHPPLPSGYADFRGTQIGVNQVNVASGFPIFDFNGITIRQSDGTFFTTENQVFAQGAAITGLRLESNVYNGSSSAVTTIPAYGVVSAQSNGTFQLGSYNDSLGTLVGMAIQNIPAGGSGAICLEGTLTNPLWNWTNYVGQLLWISGTNPGQLQTTDPHLDNPIAFPIAGVPVARVVSQDSILFLQGIGTKGPPGTPGSGSSVVPATPTVQGIVYLSTDGGLLPSPTNTVVSEIDPRLTNARTPLAHTQAATTVTVAPDPPSGTSAPNVQLALQALGLNKLNLAGGTMTGNLILNADPTTNYQAVTKQYVDNGFLSIDAEVVLKTGSTMTGPLILSGSPVQPLQSATKQYVDSVASGLIVQAPGQAATTGNLAAIYAGSPNYTLTELSNGALMVDGYTANLNDRILVKDQSTGTQNGIYVVTATGDGLNPYILTRDPNTVPPHQFFSGTFIFIEHGTTNAGSSWVVTTPNPITIDTTSITFTLFSSVAALTSGDVTTALGYTPVGPFSVTNGTAGISVSGSPVSGGSPSGIVLSLSTELLGLNSLGTLGFVQRTGTGTYIAAALTSSQITTALGYIPLASRTINTTAPLAGGGALTSDLTLTINQFTGTSPGSVPLSPGGTTAFLRADGTWSVPPGGGGGGGVSSVGMSTTSPAIILGGTNPITTAGTITVNLKLAATGAVATHNTITGGSGYTNGTYTNVPLSGGSGAGVQATVTVSGGAITNVVITAGGSNYYAADVLTVNNAYVGGTGSGFSVPVVTITPDPGITQDSNGLYVGLGQITNQMLTNPTVTLDVTGGGSGAIALGTTLSILGDAGQGVSTSLTGGTIVGGVNVSPPTVTVTVGNAGTTSVTKGVVWFDPVFFTTTTGKASWASGAGTSGQYLSSTGGTPTWITPPAMATPGAPTNSIQFNSAGSFAGSSGLIWTDGSSTLTLGKTTDTNATFATNTNATGNVNLIVTAGNISFTAGTPSSPGPGNTVTITGGTGVSTNNGGAATIVGGTAPGVGTGGTSTVQGGPSTSGTGGQGILMGGSSTSGSGGSAVIQTTPNTNANYTSRLEITSSGEWKVNGLSSVAGQVLTSAGPSTPPVWNYGRNNDVLFATAAQTMFTTTTVVTKAKSAFPNGKAYLQVFVNGVLQREDNSAGTGFGANPTGMFWVSATNQITFFTGLALNDEVTIYQLY